MEFYLDAFPRRVLLEEKRTRERELANEVTPVAKNFHAPSSLSVLREFASGKLE
jgi:hypothetical protein